MSEKSNAKGYLKLVIFFIVLATLIFIFPYALNDFYIYRDRVKINDEFRLEYAESASSISLTNGSQVFVGNVKEAYWNDDSLVVSGRHQCFLIVFGKTHYRDQMIPCGCFWLHKKLKQGTIEKYIANQK